jgi:filamentous hemagglutinin family protein
MAGLQQVKSGGSALGLAVTLALGFGAGQPPEAAAEVRAAADGMGTRVVVNGNEFTITDGKLSGANQFHSFDRFDLNSSQSARFQTPGHVKNILGRVVSPSPSMIDGLIRVSGANANLYIINPMGISFGPNARLDVPGSFHASTAQAIRLGEGWFRASGANNTDALSGAPNGFAFLHNQPGTIINSGHLQVPAGETITLMGGTVINTGTITAQGGTVNVVAVNGAKLVEVGTSQQLLSLALPAADQQTIADGLQPLTPASLPALLTGGSISHASTIEVATDGTVRLRASGAVVPSGPGVVMASGSLDASGKGSDQAVGGRVAVLADVVSLSDATVDVSGRRGGGTALIGGDLKGLGPLPTAQRTTVDGGSRIHADAIEAGDGGKVVIWADGQTLFQGQVTARGGQTSGDGGFVEISGKANLRYDGNVNTTAPKGAMGTLLLDPKTIRIVAGSGAVNDGDTKQPITAADPPDAMVISESKIEEASKINNLAFEASEGITIDKLLTNNPSGTLFNGALDLTNGITFMAGAGGFIMDSADTIKISEIQKQLKIESNGGIISLGNIVTVAGDVTIKGSQVLQPETATLVTDQGNVMITSTGKIDIGSIQTKFQVEGSKGGAIKINADQQHGNIQLESSSEDIIVSSIDTSNQFDNGDTNAARQGRGRAGNLTVTARNGVFRAKGTIAKEITDENSKISILTSGRSALDIDVNKGQIDENENFEDSGIGKVSINAKSNVEFFLTGASAIPTDNAQGAKIFVNETNRSQFLNNPQASGSIGAVIGFSTNAQLESVLSSEGKSNTDGGGNTLFTLNISKFPPPPPPPVDKNKNQGNGNNQSGTTASVGSGAGKTAEGKNSGSQDRKIEPSQNIQDLSNTKQLDQTASTTQCAEGSEKECQKEFNEALNPILDISAIKQK